jgi:hypothetical protein
MSRLQDIHPVAGSVDDTHIFYQAALDGGAKPHAVRVTAMRLSLEVGGKSSWPRGATPVLPPSPESSKVWYHAGQSFQDPQRNTHPPWQA